MLDWISKLDKDTIWPKLEEMNLIHQSKDAAIVKRDLTMRAQLLCEHKDSVNQYDLSSVLCPQCETLLEYSPEIDAIFCSNCDYEGNIEEHGSLRDLDEYNWLEACIMCHDCEYQGHPSDNGLVDKFEQV